MNEFMNQRRRRMFYSMKLSTWPRESPSRRDLPSDPATYTWRPNWYNNSSSRQAKMYLARFYSDVNMRIVPLSCQKNDSGIPNDHDDLFSMAFPLTSLPPEIISSHLLQYLRGDDIINLSKCIDFEVNERVYRQVFPNSPHFDHYDGKMFWDRVKAKLYFIGGFSYRASTSKNPPPGVFEYICSITGKMCQRMHTPLKVECGDNPVVQVGMSCGWPGESIEIVDLKGGVQMYMLHSNGGVVPFSSTRAKSREQVADNFDERRDIVKFRDGLRGYEWVRFKRDGMDSAGTLMRTELGYDPVFTDSAELREMSNYYFGQTNNTPRFDQIHSAVGVWAVDESGLLWGWKCFGAEQTQAIPLLLQDSDTGKLIKGRILKVRTGYGQNSCLVEGAGVVVYPLIRSMTEGANGWRAGYPCFADHLYAGHAKPVPGTEKGIKDYYMVESGALIALMTDGRLKMVESVGGTEIEMNGLSSFEPFVQLAGSDTNFVALCKDGRVVNITVKRVRLSLIVSSRIVEGLEDVTVVSVAAGTKHGVALTSDGEVYSWGKELYYDGVLGMGNYFDVAVHGNYKEDEQEFDRDTPVKMKNVPGKACEIYAEANLTAIMVVED